MSKQNSPIMTIMVRAAEKAARSLRRDFGEVENLQISRKGPGDFVSAADKRAEEIIFENLKRDKPDYSFLMEEGGSVEGSDPNHRWIIDPLDGTTNFLHGIPHFAISIALEQRGEIVAGVVYDPIKDEMFTAEKNRGAFMQRKRLRVSGREQLMESCIGSGFAGHSKEIKDRFFREHQALTISGATLRRYGAAALDLAYVAAGRQDAFWERNLKPWDVAAGTIIVREAGGFVYDLNNRSKNPVDTGNVIASNGGILNEMEKVLKSVK